MFGIGKSEEERRREKERKKRGMRKYGQSYLKPSRRGSISCWCTGGSLVILAGCILYAFLSRGKAAGIVGGLSVVSFVIDIYGMYCAVQGFLERDRRYLNCKIGLGVGVITLILFMAILVGGLGYMSLSEIQKERNEQCRERHELAVNRIRSMVTEETVEKAYVGYFQDVALFLLELENTRRKVASGEWGNYTLEQMRSLNEILYSDILDKNYERSYANPEYAVSSFGTEMGQLLSLLYAELRGGIHYAFEEKTDYLTILYELFIEVYNCFENAALEEASEQRTADEKESGAAGAEKQIPSAEQIREILYWYASDYCDVFLADRILEQIDPSFSFAADLIETADLDSDEYLYRFGEYISKNELGTAHHLRNLPQETLQKMADVYTEGYRIGFINTGKDLSKKKVVNIRYSLGFEKVVRLAIENFKKMGLKPVIYRAAASVITKREHHKIGYYGCIANQQYEYDHRQDQALFMDKRYIERKLEVMKTIYEPGTGSRICRSGSHGDFWRDAVFTGSESLCPGLFGGTEKSCTSL